MSVTTLLFDLDGTLLETAPGIVGCYRHTFLQLGVEIPETLDLLEFIGPPMKDNFRRLLDEAQAEAAVEIYRQCYEQKGQWQASVYEGIHQAVQTLSTTYRLMVATSKRHAFAQEMMQHFGLAPYFTAIYGVLAENLSESKAALIGRILQEQGLTSAEVVMIGDRASISKEPRLTRCARWGCYGAMEAGKSSRPTERTCCVSILYSYRSAWLV